jgi:hypothetical protein
MPDVRMLCGTWVKLQVSVKETGITLAVASEHDLPSMYRMLFHCLCSPILSILHNAGWLTFRCLLLYLPQKFLTNNMVCQASWLHQY